jgi:2-keto-4-pentenoate hydratase/2-oxohepta-3-ene-1,7-dioic acid hydratase in catechol pathway
MRLATFTAQSRTRLGVIEDDCIVDLTVAGSSLPRTVRQLLAAGPEGLTAVRRAVEHCTERIPLAQVHLRAPVDDPQKFLGLGLNYRSHVEELRKRFPEMPIPQHQVWFNKQVSCIAGPYDTIRKPPLSDSLDYEGELALVIGRRCRAVRSSTAHDVIAGFMVCNDVSVREWQMRSPTATLGKSFDTHGPIGPWLTLTDEVDDPSALSVRTWVNGALRQDGNTRDFVYRVGEMIEELTAVMTLMPGDILTTGTPCGVGAAASPPRYLRSGDTVRVEIESLGYIENTVVDDVNVEWL